MREALDAGGQVILLLNRRGFSTHVHCPACGHVAACQNCDLSLTFHRQRATLCCATTAATSSRRTAECPECGQPAIRYQGLGTEKLQAEIEEKFPDRVVQRMDSDTMSPARQPRRGCSTPSATGSIHILMGTQMIAKGLDFPNVTLVGVVNADVGLHLPDFRAAERTFQLLAQVAGRAGRGRARRAGADPDVHAGPPVHQPGGDARLRRSSPSWSWPTARSTSYPPYQRLARLIVRSQNEEAAMTFADTLAGAFREALEAARPAADASPACGCSARPRRRCSG